MRSNNGLLAKLGIGALSMSAPSEVQPVGKRRAALIDEWEYKDGVERILADSGEAYSPTRESKTKVKRSNAHPRYKNVKAKVKTGTIDLCASKKLQRRRAKNAVGLKHRKLNQKRARLLKGKTR